MQNRGNWWGVAVVLVFVMTTTPAAGDEAERVGPTSDGRGWVAPTKQVLRPAGQAIEYGGRPVDLVLAPGGRRLYAKDHRGLVAIDREGWKIVQELAFPKGGGSMHGIAISADGTRVFATTAQDSLDEATVGADGSLAWSRRIALPGPGGKGASHACGIALSADGATAYVCLSRNNTLGVVDLAEGKLVKEIPVSVAPFDVTLSSDGASAFVSNWGGRRPRTGEKTAPSSGTPVLIDERGVGKSGTVGKVDLVAGKQVAEVATGLHPADLVSHAGSGRLYVANANSDTVTVIDTAGMTVVETILVRPEPSLPFGSASNALALSADGRALFVANGGNNALAVVDLAPAPEKGEAPGASKVRGFVPTAWYPGAVVADGGELFVANVKGFGSRNESPSPKGRSAKAYLGVVSKVPVPGIDELAVQTQQVRTDARIPQMLRAWEQAHAGVGPVPVPKRLGEPSVFEHVVYVIKENRTYDQVFGDIPRGEGDPALCIYGREITPNHHALAERYVLLDNFYCNGVVSADGHSWATEGNVTDHLEKSFGGFTRSYTYGDDPLTYSSTGFLWDNVLLHGLSFRNYGEMDYATPVPKTATYTEILKDYEDGKGTIGFEAKIGIETLRRYSAPGYPGWNMGIPDVVRAGIFLKALREAEANGEWPNLTIVHLPNDHTSGTSPDMPTPNAYMADNDLALGRIVEGLSRSKFWPKTCIFVIEDDPQDGFDHIDGHRSISLVISPYTKRGAVVHDFYNQTSVLHTMERILGCPPMNQMDAMSPLMSACFQETPDLSPYEALPANVPIGQLNPKLSGLEGPELHWARLSLKQNFRVPDRVEDDAMNRILWHRAKGLDARYPAELAGAHGKGLAARRLIGVKGDDDDDDDDD
ncbi:bifunctional YncE family protein/alkaline phosphatase family protein [Singulisphaera sp. Ch08]|uniref:Bifunctional YncE family protein/alkaline phosphatase family protein n=1 Tax=Singulisphaera sp. Ch08 TaxID=3120278 RepID=A0AAU7CH16_9BACT